MAVKLILPPNLDKYYDEASAMEIVGIACRRLFSNLCPRYEPKSRDDWPLAVDKSPPETEKRIAWLKKSKLYNALKNGLRIKVYVVNPCCDYAYIRRHEERLFNPDCRRDMLRGVAALQALAMDLKNETDRDIWSIKGKLEVFLIRDNPSVTYTHIKLRNHQRELLIFGFLLRGITGDSTRRIYIEENGRTIQNILQPFLEHIGLLDPFRVFSWGSDGAKFTSAYPTPGGYDAFFCHNSQDTIIVKTIQEEMSRRGLVCWLDVEDLRAGDDWERRIHEAIRRVRCAVMFFGPNKVGLYQAAEIMELWRREKLGGFTLIPVLLKGADENPAATGLLNRLHWIDVEKRGSNALDELEEMIRRANGIT